MGSHILQKAKGSRLALPGEGFALHLHPAGIAVLGKDLEREGFPRGFAAHAFSRLLQHEIQVLRVNHALQGAGFQLILGIAQQLLGSRIGKKKNVVLNDQNRFIEALDDAAKYRVQIRGLGVERERQIG
jgi:hypothetical protein